MNIAPVAADFPADGAWRARLADGSLSDSFAQSYGLLAAHGETIRRAYQLDGARVHNRSWRTLCAIAAADERADGMARLLDKMAEAVGAVRSGHAGFNLAKGYTAQAGVISQAFDRLALALHDRDAVAFQVQLSDIAAQSHALESMVKGYKGGKDRWQEACENSERDANRLAGELAAEREERALAFRSRDALAADLTTTADRLDVANAKADRLGMSLRMTQGELADMDRARGAAVRETEAMRRAKVEAERSADRLRSDLAASRAAHGRDVGDSRAYREQRDAEGARAVAAERQLAEYRSLIGRVTYGAGLANPAILALGRAYLADMESAK